MVKKGSSVDDAIKKTVKEGIKAGMEELSQLENLDDGIQSPVLEAEFHQAPGEEISPEEWHLDTLLENVPRSKGYYIKLYKYDDSVPTKWVFKEKITDYESWKDLEDDLRNYVAKKTQKNPHRWGSGIYKIMIFREGYKGFHKRPMEIPIDIDEIISDNKDVKGQISEVGEILRAAKDILTDKKAPEDMSKTIAEIFKSGVDVMKNSMPVSKESDNSSMLQAVSLLKELGLLGGGNKDDLMIKILVPLITNSLQPKQDDFWDKLGRLKELGVIKTGDDGSGDGLGSIDKVTQLVELTQTLTNMGLGGTGEKPSVGIEIVRLVAPQLQKIIGDITGAIKAYSDMKKSSVIIPGGISPSVRPVLPINQGASETDAPSHSALIEGKQPELFDPYANLNLNSAETPLGEVRPETPAIKEVKPMNPVIRKIYDAIEARDKNFYLDLKSMMTMYIGPHILESLVSGSITTGAFLQQLATMTSESFFMEDRSKVYFNEFVDSVKQELEASMVSAKCGTCNEIYDYSSEEEFEKDSKTCDNCGGTIEKIQGEKVGTA